MLQLLDHGYTRKLQQHECRAWLLACFFVFEICYLPHLDPLFLVLDGYSQHPRFLVYPFFLLFFVLDMLMWSINAVDSMMRSPRGYINLLRLAWLLAILYGEVYIFWSTARHCAPWPGKAQHVSNVSSDDSGLRLTGNHSNMLSLCSLYSNQRGSCL